MILDGEMVLVQKGYFEMGSGDIDADDSEKPRHEVWVNEFNIDKYMVTNKQFAEFCEDTNYLTTAEIDEKGDTFINGKFRWVEGANWRHPYGPLSSIEQKADHPVVLVTVRDALAYCAWRSKKEKRYFRLPTEAEWEKAAVGTDGRQYPWGNDPPTEAGIVRARYNDGSLKGTASVGSFPEGVSFYGCMGMAGNAWEWCIDAMDRHYYKKAPDYDVGGPLSLSCDNVFRGGSHIFPEEVLKSTCRHSNHLGRPSVGIGFRTVAPSKKWDSVRLRVMCRMVAYSISRMKLWIKHR